MSRGIWKVALATLLAIGGTVGTAGLAAISQASPAGANGVALSAGDVLASIGSGLVKNFSPSGTLLDTLDTGTSSTYTTGGCFDSSGHFYVTDFGSNELSQFTSGGTLSASTWASEPSTPESCTVDASNNVYVGGPGAATIFKFNSSGTLTNSFSVTGGSGTGGADWVDLAKDQCTILYTGEGSEILSYNVCTNTQNADFATSLPAPCFELRFRPNGDVMVACESEVLRYNSAGTLQQTYTIPGTGELFSMNLDPDNSTFWTGDDQSGEIYHIDIATGTVLSHFNSAPSSGLFGLALVGGISVAQPTLVLSPPTATKTVGTTDTITATITNPGNSISGQTVTFHVTGANTASGTGTTNASGQTTFTYTGTHQGSDTITGTFKGATGTAKVRWVTGGDRTPPACALTAVVTGPPKAIKITVQDTGSGLASVSVTTHSNANVTVPAFTTGTTTAVVVTATKVNQVLASQVALQVKDVNGNTTNCDPVLATLQAGSVTSAALAASEHYVKITNGSRGLRVVTATVNGHVFRTTLRNGTQRLLDIGAAMHAGNNTVTLRGAGAGAADVLVWDGSS